MSFLVILRPARDAIEEETEILEAHWAYVRRLHEAGKIVVAGPSWHDDDPFGIGVVDVRERAEVEAILADDPRSRAARCMPRSARCGSSPDSRRR